MTNQQWVETATQILIQQSRLERSMAHLHARLLLDGATGKRFSHLLAPESTLEPATIQKLQQWTTDAVRGRPIPYILNKAPFFGLEWQVDERVLIPRPETELLVETVLQKAPDAPRIADLGTGSGIVAVSLKKTRPRSTVYGLDISPGALEIAALNAHNHGVEVHLLQGTGEWIAPLQPFAPFDVLVSNPPYIPSAEIKDLEIGVRDFEPRLALDGGADGLNPYRAIAKNAREVLTSSGFVALELGAAQFDIIRQIFVQNRWHVEAARCDLAGIERVLVAQPAAG